MKIKCFVLIYDNLEIIKRSLESITAYADRMEIHVVENPSEYTSDYIKPIMKHLLHEGKIHSYTLFDKNIRNNAIYTFLYEDPVNFWDSDYIILTDGDIVAEHGWLDNQLLALEKYSEVFCCSVEMSTEYWSEGLKKRFPVPSEKLSDFTVIDSGIWLCMFRADELHRTFSFLMDNQIALRDGPLIRYVKEFLRMKWGVTPHSKCSELTRSGYSTPDYTRQKKSAIAEEGGNQAYWVHSTYSGFRTSTREREVYVSAEEQGIARIQFRDEKENFLNDYLCEKIQSGEITLDTLYFGINIKHAIKGKSYLGNCDTLSFYHKETETKFIRCNISKGLYPSLEKCIQTVFVYDAFANLKGELMEKAVRFVNRALIDGGSFTVFNSSPIL